MRERRTTPFHGESIRRAAGGALRAATVAAALFALARPGVAAAGGVSLGAGVLIGRVSSEALQRTGSPTGLEVSFGYRALERVSFDMHAAVLGTEHPTRETTGIYYPPDVAEASFLGLGLRVDLLSLEARRWTPWLGAGVGVATLNWDEFFYYQQGGGAYLAAGVDFEPVTGLILRGRAMHSGASMSDNYDDDAPRFSATTASLSVVYEFGRSRRPRTAPGPAPPPAAEREIGGSEEP